ncbi:unnamed protein product [Kluyveromyces dobzhanskii CBS 2104]|uniref:Ornithine decarboxylase n=1 Tax=Kluyveromyces dobzhanskii CBS 2104 TaxID=1427455 RepID=A0A0A8L1L6_9SACH|nr:unnamed protein product [Kluyveromyces dobzhanskii CBS 2104]
MNSVEQTERLAPSSILQGVSYNPIAELSSKQQAELPHEQSHEKIFRALKEKVDTINHETCDAGDENSFFVCDLGEVARLKHYWAKLLPRVTPFYAVKCNPNLEIIKRLASMSTNFDCASKSEIEKVLSCGVAPERIIYANPCKASSFIRFAAKNGVKKSTFDNVDELYKIQKYHPESELLLRIVTDDSSAQCRLSTKYGCKLDDVPVLLETVKELGLNLIGVSFHVGSGASDFSTVTQAVKDARDVFDIAESYGLPALKMLDVGGGYQFDTITEVAGVLNAALDHFFPQETHADVSFIAEPGRYFVATAFTLAATVIGKRNVSDKESMIYINDGVYGNMNCILFDHQEPTPRVLYHNDQFSYMDSNTSSKVPTEACKNRVSMWGPTCDGLDCVSSEFYMKYDLDVGDWVYFSDIGAYTCSAATPFNGFEQTVDIIFIDSAL